MAVWGAAIVRFRPVDVLLPARARVPGDRRRRRRRVGGLPLDVVQIETPDELRGRVAAIHILVVTSGPRLGDIEAAMVASVIGAQLSVISGGLLCLLGVGVVMRAFPELDAHIATDTPAASAPAAAAGGSG